MLRIRSLSAATAALLLSACAGESTAPEAVTHTDATAAAQGQPAADCMNVAHQGMAWLSPFVELPNGVSGLGGAWTPTTLGDLAGEMASVVTVQSPSGAKAQGATHLTLVHAFRLDAENYFITQDRAVCAPAGADPTTCRVNDVLTIVDGVGIFADARGQLRNHGIIDFVNGTLTTDIRGRVCGDGI